eukprot:PhF_6_TR9232/c1_g1_i1/m.14550
MSEPEPVASSPPLSLLDTRAPLPPSHSPSLFTPASQTSSLPDPKPPDPPPEPQFFATKTQVCTQCSICQSRVQISNFNHYNACEARTGQSLSASFFARYPNVARCAHCAKIWWRSTRSKKATCGSCNSLVAGKYHTPSQSPASFPAASQPPNLPRRGPSPVQQPPPSLPPPVWSLSASELLQLQVTLADSATQLEPCDHGVLVRFMATPLTLDATDAHRSAWIGLARSLGFLPPRVAFEDLRKPVVPRIACAATLAYIIRTRTRGPHETEPSPDSREVLSCEPEPEPEPPAPHSKALSKIWRSNLKWRYLNSLSRRKIRKSK